MGAKWRAQRVLSRWMADSMVGLLSVERLPVPSETLVEIHSWEVHCIFKTKNVSIKDLLVIFLLLFLPQNTLQKQLSGGRVVLAYSLSWWGSHGSRYIRRSAVRKQRWGPGERSAGSCPALVFLFLQSKSPGYGVVPRTVGVCLPSSLSPVWKKSLADMPRGCC